MRTAITILIFCVGALLSLGMVMLYSSSTVQVGARYLVMQLIWCVAGLIGCVFVASQDYQKLKKYVWWFYALAAVMLVLVLIPGIGLKINGARRWFDLGVARLQPSEFAKIALIFMLAWYGERFQRQMPGFKQGLVIPGAFAAVLIGLIFIEPDRGTAILLSAITCVLLLVAGVRMRFFVPPVVVGIVALGFSIWHDPMRMKRVFSWLYLEENKEGVGYQAWQAMIALGSGGWSGLGLGNGRQKLGFVPEHHTDFILSIIGEELGLIATIGVVIGFVGIVACGVYIASKAKDTFGRLLATGITFLIGLQAFINIGVVTSALPNKGISLPFISYGGSNLLVMLTAVGLLLSVARQAPSPVEAEIKGTSDLPNEALGTPQTT
ncbi:MAG TPA: putative lipid II flippase FtsW [Verrucomicrobiae bacterium]